MKETKKRWLILVGLGLISFAAALFFVYSYGNQNPKVTSNSPAQLAEYKPEITKSESEWRDVLTPQQYHILREKGTDPPFSETELLNEHRKGTFVTADCGEPVFRSEAKFDSGTGWPSFTQPVEGSVVEIENNSLGTKRTEIVGKKCGGHLGHVFNDGPKPAGLRYCINPSALKFIPDSLKTN